MSISGTPLAGGFSAISLRSMARQKSRYTNRHITKTEGEVMLNNPDEVGIILVNPRQSQDLEQNLK